MAAPVHAAPIHAAPYHSAPAVLPSAPSFTPAPSITPAPTVVPESIQKAPMKTGAAEAPATIIVSVPANAKLTIDDAVTASTAAQRVFVTPALTAGKSYHYNMKVEYVQDGKPVIISKKIDVTAGNETTVNFVEQTVAGR